MFGSGEDREKRGNRESQLTGDAEQGKEERMKGTRVQLRPIRDEDWALFEEWGKSREALWGPFQRFQIDHVPMLRQAYQQS